MTSRSESSQHHASSSSPSGSRKVPAIFLSHSGHQKEFVERLYEALRRVNHDPFFDKVSLRKGQDFPEDIKIAARECTLGVVILSEDFVTSKWPMIELEILVHRRGPNIKLLPLFYKLGPADLKSSKKLKKWRKKWEKMLDYERSAKRKVIIEEWEKCLKVLRSLNGEIHVQGTSKAEYIKRVVRSICLQVPCPLPYDMSEIVGHERLAEEVARKFDGLCRAWQDGGACMVGLHGVGGLGKSTLLKIMANFYSSMYAGRFHHPELPTEGRDMGIIVVKCKQALRVLADLDDHYLIKVDDFDQAHLTRHDVFLAIDNVWESSQTAVGRLLKVGFSAGCKILVTSRSEELLNDLLRNQMNARVDPLPAPDDEEAYQIFQEAYGLGDLNSLTKGKEFVPCALQRCKYGGTYHALALKALGMHVQRARPPQGWRHFREEDLSSILEWIGIARLESVDDVIRLTYDSLREHMKHAFLDIVLLPTMRCGDGGQLPYDRACYWLSVLYKKQSPEAMIKELCLSGLLQQDTVEDTGERIIRVHDLLSGLAEREAASSCRFLIAGSSSRVVEEIQWPELERVILDSCEEICTLEVIERLQQQECPRLQVLDAVGVGFLQGIDMRRMPALCVLMLQDVHLRSIQNWAASALVHVELWDVHLADAKSLNIHFMTRGETFKIWSYLLNLVRSRMEELKHEAAVVEELEDTSSEEEFKEIEDLDTLLYYANSSNLGAISACFTNFVLLELDHLQSKGIEELEYASSEEEFKEIQDLGRAGIEELEHTSSEEEIKEIEDVGTLQMHQCLDGEGRQSLESVGLGTLQTHPIPQDVAGPALEKMPDGSGSSTELILGMEIGRGIIRLPFLQYLILFSCEALKEADLSGLTLLKTIVISTCSSLEKVSDLSGLTHLVTFSLTSCECLKELGGLSSNLMSIHISYCTSLKKVPDISGLTRLEMLVLVYNFALEEVEGHSISSSLATLFIRHCRNLRRYPKEFEGFRTSGKVVKEFLDELKEECEKRFMELFFAIKGRWPW